MDQRRKDSRTWGRAGTAGAAVALGLGLWGFAAAVEPPKKPADLRISVEPESVEPGSLATVSVEIVPKDGIKINRYPKVKVEVLESPGLVAAAQVAVGSDTPPPPEKLNRNYFEKLEPLELELSVDPAAASGIHHLDGKVTYFYCVPKSGFCAPARVPVKIPLSVR